MPNIRSAKLADILPDEENLNVHTERGMFALARSVEKYGAREAGVLDKFGRLVAGNNRAEVYADLGLDDIVIVEAEPGVPIFVRYPDLDLGDGDNIARPLSVAVNRVSQLSIALNPGAIALLAMNGMNLSDWYESGEQDALLSAAEDRDPELSPHTHRDDGLVLLQQSVSFEAFSHYRELMAQTEGNTEVERFASLLGTVNPATWLKQRAGDDND